MRFVIDKKVERKRKKKRKTERALPSSRDDEGESEETLTRG